MKAKLHDLLLKIPKVYDDFVLGIEIIIQDNVDVINKVVKYLEDNPEATKTEVYRFVDKIISRK